MEETKTLYHCLNCDSSETEVPLITLRHNGSQTFLCTRCLPILIHRPQQLIGKLPGAEKLEPVVPPDH